MLGSRFRTLISFCFSRCEVLFLVWYSNIKYSNNKLPFTLWFLSKPLNSLWKILPTNHAIWIDPCLTNRLVRQSRQSCHKCWSLIVTSSLADFPDDLRIRASAGTDTDWGGWGRVTPDAGLCLATTSLSAAGSRGHPDTRGAQTSHPALLKTSSSSWSSSSLSTTLSSHPTHVILIFILLLINRDKIKQILMIGDVDLSLWHSAAPLVRWDHSMVIGLHHTGGASSCHVSAIHIL